MKIILSIKPEYVEKIFSGEKKYEYRKNIFKDNNVNTVIIYSTKPEGKVVGEFSIKKVINKKIENLWEETKGFSGVTREFYEKYFQDKDQGYAIAIDKVKRYDQPLNLKELGDNLTPPQSFCYIN